MQPFFVSKIKTPTHPPTTLLYQSWSVIDIADVADILHAAQVFDDMQARGVLADVVTCCSLINALERGGQWQLAEQLFVQMCAASWQAHGVNSPLYRIMEIAAAPCPPQDAVSPPSEQSPRLCHAHSQSWEHHDSDVALVMRESSLVATSPQRSNPLTSDMTSYSSPMLSPIAQMPGPPSAAPVTPAGHSFDSSLSSSFPKHSSASPDDQTEISQPDRPFISTPSKQVSLGSQDSGSNPRMYTNDLSKHSLFSRDPAGAIGREADSTVIQTSVLKRQGTEVHPVNSSGNSSSRWVSKDKTSPVMHTPPDRHPSAESRPAGRSSSDYIPELAHANSSPEIMIPNATCGLDKNSPDYSLLNASSTACGETGGAGQSELLRSFTNMRVGSTSQSVQRALFPPEALRLQKSSGLIGSPQQPLLRHQTAPGITHGSSPLRSLTSQNSFGHGDNLQPALRLQADSLQDSILQGSSMHQTRHTKVQQGMHHPASFPQETKPLLGLIHQSSMNNIGSHRVLRPLSSFSGESGVLSSQIELGHQGTHTQGSSESRVLRQQGSFGGCHIQDERSNATVRRIQEAAVDRQELLSLTPTTTPVGGSRGQAPVLRHMNVSQIAPNRVCCNALLAAYARARPTCWQKVICRHSVAPQSRCTVIHRCFFRKCIICFSGALKSLLQGVLILCIHTTCVSAVRQCGNFSSKPPSHVLQN